MSAMNVVVTMVRSRIEADIVVGLLQGYGIAAMATSDDMAGLDLALQQSGGVRVLVPAEQLDEARQVLAEATADDAGAGEPPTGPRERGR